jgi:hypothetical protein
MRSKGCRHLLWLSVFNFDSHTLQITWSGLRLGVLELWRELFTRASFLIGQSLKQGD